MRITIDTEILRKHNLSLGQFIILLTSYCSLDCQKIKEELIEKGFAERNLFQEFPPIISDNIKNLIAKILVESDEKLKNCPIKDFEALAVSLQNIYPDGIKPGKTYSWRGTVDVIAQKLRTLVATYNFSFTEEEAINATKEYVSSFKPPYTYMHTLRNFLLYNKADIESIFMTIIENNRAQEHLGGNIGDLDDALG